MPFVLRQEGDTTNPSLATVYGKQITRGKTVYYIKEGRVKCIIILGEGEMDGVDKVYYNGEVIPEFASTNPGDRNWKFHPGTVTKQPTTFFDVTAIAGDTLTLNAPYGVTSNAVKETITATGGSRKLSYGGQTTAAVPYNANAATIQTALENLSNLQIGDITVTGTGPFTYTFGANVAEFSTWFTVEPSLLTGGTSTLSRPGEVALVAGVDPEPTPYPVGVKQNQKLYVVSSVGNNIKLSLTPGGTALTWTSSAYLLANLKVYTADGGFFDPVQGRPEFFPGVDFTLSRIAYIEVNLPAEMSEIEDDEPTKFEIFVRGRRLQNYDATGTIANAIGVAYGPSPPAQTKFFSANNALVALDIILNYMKVDPSRIDWASWVVFRDHCDAQITWNSGSLKVLGNPNFTLTNAISAIAGTLRNSGVGTGWTSGAISTQGTTLLDSITASAVYRGTHSVIGLTRAVASYLAPGHAGSLYSIEMGNPDGRVKLYSGGSLVYNQVIAHQDGDTFKVDVYNNTVDFFKNDTLLYTEAASFGAGTTKLFAGLNVADGFLTDIKFYPVTGANRVTTRFDAHVVFAQETDSQSALQQVMGRAPSCHWQDVNGKIKFIVGTNYKDVTWGETPAAGDRVLAEILSYDPNSTAYTIGTGASVNRAADILPTATSQLNGNFPVSSLTNGQRTANGNWNAGEGWHSLLQNVSVDNPQSVTIDFGIKRYLNKLSIFTVADDYNTGSVSPTDTFTLYGVQNFTVEYWNGNAWTLIESVVDNNLVWRDMTFPLVSTSKIRMTITKTVDAWARLFEIEAWGPDTIQTVVPRSNIVADSVSFYKTPPENKPNFMRLEVRDLDDPFYTKKYVYVDRDQLRDQTDMLVDLGVMPLGVASQSLADRIGESVMHWGSDLDLFVNVKGMPSTYALSKGDILRFAHPVAGWTLDSPVEFIVIEETIESGADTADEKTYLLQVYNTGVYSDTAHGAITANFPTTISPLTPPPVATALELTEETRTLPDGTAYSAILGRVYFDSDYPYNQRARVFWKKALDVEFIPTNIILEQPNTGVGSIPFELNFATIGINQVKVVTETLSGVTSQGSVTQNIDISGTAQIEQVDWEQFVNTDLLGNYLVKVGGAAAYDAGAKSTKALGYGDGYLQFTYDSAADIVIGFNNYNLTDNSDVMKYGFKVSNGVNPVLMINGSPVTGNSNTVVAAVGQSFKIDVIGNTVNFYQIVSNVANLVGTTTNTQYYPLYVDCSIYTMGHIVPPVQVYGRLEPTSGLKVHWATLNSVSVTSDVNGVETTRKITGDGWATPFSSNTFSAERILNSGSIEWVATETNKYRMVGLSEIDAELANPDIAGYVGLKYAVDMEDGGALSFWYFGANDAGTTSYTTGDILRLEKINGQVRVRKNGVIVHTFATPTTGPLYVDTALFSQNSTIKDVKIKRIGAFTPIAYTYPIYLMQDLTVLNNRPQDDGSTYFELIGVFSTVGEEPIQRAKVKVYNKFGELVVDLPPFTYSGNGYIGQGYHDRKYADPNEEAIYEVRLDNGNGWSGSVFVQGGATLPYDYIESFTMPALLNPVYAVKDLICAPVDHNRISVSWTYTNPGGGSNNIDIQYRKEGEAWAAVPSGSNVSTKPFVATALLPNTVYEFRACPTGTAANWSNICRTKTLQAPLPADVAPPPLDLIASLNSAAPTTSVDLSWNRNSITSTSTKVYKDGVLSYTTVAPTETSRTVSGLTPNTTYTFKVVNQYGGGPSIDSNLVTITTASVESISKPSGLSAFAASWNRINLSWTNNTAAGNVEIERSYDGETGWTLIGTVAATIASYANTLLDESTTYFYRVKNTTVTGYSNIASATTFEHLPVGCILPTVLVWTVESGQFVQVPAGDLRPGDVVVTVLKGGEIKTTRIKRIIPATTDALHIITMESGQVLECTPSHPLIENVAGDIIKAKAIGHGSQLLTLNDQLDKVVEEVVESKETLYGSFKVMIFELEGEDHTFVSSGIVSHNISSK